MNNLFKSVSLTVILGLTMSSFVESHDTVQADYHVIPLPQKICLIPETKPFVLDRHTRILYPIGNLSMKRNAQFLAGYLKKITGDDYIIQAGSKGTNAIILNLGLNSSNKESYRLKVGSSSVSISSSNPAGVFYGIQTLRKSLSQKRSKNMILPAVIIDDCPRFAYRGALLDVSRHFFSLADVKTYLDMMAMHNMNYFHWHLIDDQGWRLEIKKYPNLTKVGSQRSETVIGRNSDKYDGKPYGGYYTQKQAKEIVKYAADRYITVVPEIDMPGHTLAALASYPYLGCTGGPYKVATKWGPTPDVLCVGNDKTLTFVDDVLTELVSVFPSHYIFIDGDSCSKVRWEKCPKCQARIKALGLVDDKKHKKEEKLEFYFVRHIENFLRAHGRTVFGWTDMLEYGLTQDAMVMSGRSDANIIKAADSGHKVVSVPFFFDNYQSKDVKNEPLAIGGYLPMEEVYHSEPMPPMLSTDKQKFLYGVQGDLWSEYITTGSLMQYMVLPRWAALSEIQWTLPEKKDYKSFLLRLPCLINLYQMDGYNYYAIPN